MKKAISKLITLTALTMFIAFPSSAYVIDGLVNDWGINLAPATTLNYLDTHLPSGGLDIDYVTEDNAINNNQPWKVTPQWSFGNSNDAEAIYFDNDDTNIYISIIQGMPITGSDAPAGWSPSHVNPGDVALSIKSGSYNFGLDIIDSSNCNLVSNPVWENGIYSGTPYKILSGLNLGSVPFAYSTLGISGHYVMEAKVPLASLGLNSLDKLNIHWTMSCGNDYLTLNADVNPSPVPEPSTIILLITGFFGSLLTLTKNKYKDFRRVSDVIISSIGLLLSLPIVVAAAILIKLDSRGPVFYKQVRVGINRRTRGHDSVGQNKRSDDTLGKPFTIYKLRTMRIDAEAKTGAVWAKVNDDRVTKFGKFMRLTRIDEIPQFINVLKGDMSIIGPRPERPFFVKELANNIDGYKKRFSVKPGITGLAQVNYKYASSLKDTKKKLKYDLLYAHKHSFVMDINIAVNTFFTIIFAKGSR